MDATYEPKIAVKFTKEKSDEHNAIVEKSFLVAVTIQKYERTYSLWSFT